MDSLDTITTKVLCGRRILGSVIPWLDQRESLLITGTRQCGKTSLLHLLVRHLANEGRLEDDNLAFLDMEDPRDAELVSAGHRGLLESFRLMGKRWSLQRPLRLFIDEVHLLEDPARLMKLLVDHHPDVRLIATGSSATSIRAKFRDSLPGRKMEFHLSTLSFPEYLTFRGMESLSHAVIRLEDAISGKAAIPSPDAVRALSHELSAEFALYVLYGGYPAVVLSENDEIKRRRLGSIFNDYVRKDLGTLFTVGHLEEFTRLVKMLAAQSCGILSLSSLSTPLGINYRTLKRYLEILESTFIAERLQPCHANVQKRLVKSPKIYFHDNGLRNCAVGDFSSLDHRADAGALVEGSVFHHLRALYAGEKLSFWRTAAGGEVDFVAGNCLIEAKKGAAPHPSRALRECLRETGIRRAIVLNNARSERASVDGCEIVYLPYWLTGP